MAFCPLSTGRHSVAEQLKVLLYDIETGPAIAYVWRADTEYVPMDMMLHPPFLINWGAKWLGGTKIHSGLVTPEEAIVRDDKRIVSELADIIRQADLIVAHNGDRFDLPVLNGRILKHQLETLGPVKTIDTLKLSKASFSLPYNKLDFLGEYLDLGRKIKTDMDLWKGCIAGDIKALKQMQKYNKRDVELLEQVFERLRPYAKGLARMQDASYEGEFACPNCGGWNLIVNKHRRTQAGTFTTYQCKDCGRYCSYPSADRAKKLAVRPL
jgi:predicted RNA-binding Zn-ribbon protein involved in translation (DUF1610 family)